MILPPVGMPIRYYCKPGVVADHDKTKGLVLLKFDIDESGRREEEWVDDIDCIHLLSYGAMADFALTSEPGEAVRYSPFGYVIGPDSRIHALRGRALHGVVLALLFADQAAAMGYRQPDLEADTGHYTRFQMEAKALPAVRISFGYLTAVAVSKGHCPISQAQIESTRQALLASRLNAQSTINCSHKDLNLPQCLEWLAQDNLAN